MKDKNKVVIFIDDESTPLGVFDCPVKFKLDTRKLQDGEHRLRLVSQDPTGKEGVRIIPFTVRNGPEISVEGIKENAVIDGELPILINAYGKGDSRKFLVEGAETPRSVPSWVWASIIFFFAWAAYYSISSFI